MADGLNIRVLGCFAVDGVDDRAFGSRKVRTMMARLALADGQVVPIDELIEVVWGDALPARPRDQLGVLVARARRVVGADRLVRSGAGYALMVDRLDLRELEGFVFDVGEASAAGRLSEAGRAARTALLLLQGRVLPDEEGGWVEAAASRASSAGRAAREAAARAAVAVRDWAGALVFAEQSLVEDPYDETALRIVMSAHAEAGRCGSALAAYGRLRRRLIDDLGVSPSAETEALHDRLLRAGDAPTRSATPALVGRTAELAQLNAALEEVRRGACAAVTVVGAGGIGKSAVVASWSGSLSRDELLVCVGRCDPLGRDLPLQPVADALAALLRTVDPDILGALPAGERTVIASLTGAGGDRGLDVVVPVDEAAGRQRLFSSMFDALTCLAAGRATVLVVEDLHWASALTLGWLAFVLRRGDRVLVVGTRRGLGPQVPGERIVELDALDVGDVVAWFGEDDGPGLHVRTGGVPLLLLAAASAPSAEPSGMLRGWVERELGQLGHAAETVRCAAVLGPDIDVELLATVQRRRAVAVLDDLDAAAVAGLLTDAESGMWFRHELVREEVERHVPISRRSLLHREAARALSQRIGAPPLVVAGHARRGGDDELAVAAWIAAARQAEVHADLDRAETLLNDAIEVIASPAAFVARARVRMSRGDMDGAAADASRAIEVGGGALALEIAGWVAYYRRRYDEASALATEGLASATSPELRVGCLALSGRVAHGHGELPMALEQLRQADREQVGPGHVAGVWRALALLHAGQSAEALSVSTRALTAGPEMEHPFARLHGHFARSMALGHLGRIAEAFEVCDRADRVIEEAGVVGDRFRFRMQNVRGWLLGGVGHIDEAVELHEAVIAATGHSTGGPSSERHAEAFWVANLDLASDFLLSGDVDRASTEMDRLTAIDGWNGTMAWHQRHRVGLLRARLALATGDGPTAAGLGRSVRDDARDRSALRYAVLAAAIVALADSSVPTEEVATVVDALEAAGAIEAWWLSDMLAKERAVAPWQAVAERRAEALIRAAGPFSASLRRRVESTFAGGLRAY